MIEYEKILIASWLSGYNREHVKEFDMLDFPYYHGLFTEIGESMREKGKVEPVEAAERAGLPVSELSEIFAANRPTLYEGAYRQIKTRRIKRMLTQTTDRTDFEELAKQIVREIEALDIDSIEEPPDYLQNFIKELDRRAKERPLKFGLANLDRVTGGIRPQELTTIAARPSVGKSAMALQIAMNAVRQDKKVLFFSAEMNDIQITERLVCKESDVSSDSLKRGLVHKGSAEKEMWMKFSVYMDQLAKIKDKFLLQVKTRKLAGVKRAIAYYKPDLVIVDQLSLITDDKMFKSIRERFSYITMYLKTFAMDMGVPILLLAQINRDAQENIPNLANLKESGSIEEDSDNVILIHRLTEEQTGETGRYAPYDDLIENGNLPVMIKVEKQRNGQTGIIYAAFKGEKFTFTELRK